MDTERGVLNTEVYWGEKGRASGRGRWGGITLGEIPDVGDGGWRLQTTMACVYLCNNPARSAHVPQNLTYNKKGKKCKVIEKIIRQSEISWNSETVFPEK